MTQFLNLDELAPAKKTFTLGGETHEVRAMTVADFLKRQKEAKAVEETTDETERFESAVSMVVDAVPTIDRDVLMALTMPQIIALINFIAAGPEAPKAEAEAEAAEGDAGK